MAGEAGGRILPLLLTQRARNRAEEAALRARLGIRGFGDMTALLSAVSRHLVDLLRVSGGGKGWGGQRGEGCRYQPKLSPQGVGGAGDSAPVSHLCVRVCMRPRCAS